MWREQIKHSRGAQAFKNNRIRIVIAVIFLLCSALIYRLFNLQIKQCDLYTALADSQHRVSSQLTPDRGRIFLSDKINGQETLYALATNKDFAFLYAVPKDISDPRAMAEKLFNFFDASKFSADAAKEAISPSPSSTGSSTADISSTTASSSASFGSFEWYKEREIANYLKRLDKPGDPYEPLKDKMSEADLVALYAFLATTPETPVRADELELRSGEVVYKNDKSKSLNIVGFGFDLRKYRYYPEKNVASHLLGFVSSNGEKESGRYGLEEFFNEELFGKYGYLKSEHGAKSDLIIVNDREYSKPVAGSDLVLTIDRAAEFMACSKLQEAVKKHGATGGSVVAINPKTGAILAMCSVPDFDANNYKDNKNMEAFNNPVISAQYEPGSVYKTITMAGAIDQGKVSPSTTYNDPGQMMVKGWNKPISNSDFSSKGAHGVVDMNFVLENSLNTGAIFAMRQTGLAPFVSYAKNFGFGERTGIELGAEASGNIDNLLHNKIKEIDAATASFGQGISVTPLQMVMSYAAIANKGILMKPYLVKEIIRPDGKKDIIMPKEVRRVISEKTAATILAMLANVVENGHSKRAALNGYYIGGKTGTAQIAENGGYAKNRYIHTFVGIAPIDNPQIVMLTKIDNPQGVEYAEGSVVPLWHDIADFLLNYYQVPKTRK